MQRVFGDLDALRYVDGRLDEERRAAFASYLGDHPEAAERAALWIRQNDTLRAAFANIMLEPIPVALRLSPMAAPSRGAVSPPVEFRRTGATLHVLPGPMPDRSRTGSPPSHRPGRDQPTTARFSHAVLRAALLFGAAALVIVIAHGSARHLAERDEPAAILADEAAPPVSRAADAHATYAVDPIRPVELPATQRTALTGWIKRRLGLPVEPADLQAQGWSLLGGRLVPGVGGPAALFVYENATGVRLSLFVDKAGHSSPSPLAFRASGGDTAAMTWGDGVLDYVVTVRNSLDWLSRNGMALKERISRSN